MRRDQRALEALVHGLIAIALFIVARQLWTSDLGMDTRASNNHLVVTAVDPGGAAERAGIAVGDEIVDLPGLAIMTSSWTERELYESNAVLGRAMARGHVAVRVSRDGRALDVDVVPLPAPRLPAAMRQLRRCGSDLPTAFAFLGVAALLLRARSRSAEDDRARRIVAAAFALLGPAWTVAWPAPGWPHWLYPVASFFDVWSGCAGVALLVSFAWSYPKRALIVERPIVRWAVVLAAIPCAAISSSNTLCVIDVPRGLHGNALVILFDSGLAVAMVAGLVWQRARAKGVVDRRQASWLIGSVVIGLFVPILALLIPKHVFGLSSATLERILFPFPLVVPVGFAAVVARYRLFALDGFALRVAPYAIAVVTSLIVCVLITLGLQAALEWRTGTPSDAARWVGVLAAIVIAEPARRALQALVDRAFGRDRDAFVRQCSELAARLSGTSDPKEIESAVQTSLDARTVRLLSLDAVLPDESADAVRMAFAKSGTARVLDLRDPHALEVLHAEGLELLVLVAPAQASESATQALAFTLPRPASSLARPEADALALVGRVIGASLAQTAARRALDGEMQRARDERQHIAMELHDGLGATLAAASLMTRNLRARSAETSDRTLDALDAALRDGLGDLRVSLWSLDPDQASWDGLVARLRRHTRDLCDAAKIELVFDAHGAPAHDLSAAARLTILRVAQQAVSNAIEHGAPSRVEIRIATVDTDLTLMIDDDGIGIAADAPRGRGLGNMARRVEAFGGTFEIGRRAAGGTRVAVTLPIARLAREIERRARERPVTP